MTVALVPAAGKSTRMGRPKLALPLGQRTVLEHVMAALKTAGLEQVLVVVGPQGRTLAELAGAAGAEVLALAEDTPDMRATVEAGLRWIEDRFAPRAEDDWLLAPADHPTLDAAVVRRVLETRAEHPEASVIVPLFRGRRGHPTLIGWQHVAGIRSLPAGAGLNVYLRQQAAHTLAVAVETPSVLCDLDTPEDYERLLRQWPP
jgi:molybdenum cofactor cytidylyltransferase